MEQIFKDPDADARSAMMSKPLICTGEATGFQCKHYWRTWMKMDAANSDLLLKGELLRRCLLVQPTQNLNKLDLPWSCNQYVQSDRPYDASDEKYEPLTEEEVAHLRKVFDQAKANNQPYSAEQAIATFRAEMGKHD